MSVSPFSFLAVHSKSKPEHLSIVFRTSACQKRKWAYTNIFAVIRFEIIVSQNHDLRMIH